MRLEALSLSLWRCITISLILTLIVVIERSVLLLPDGKRVNCGELFNILGGDQGFAGYWVHLVDDCVKHLLLLHEPVIHRLLLDESIDGAVLPLGVSVITKRVQLCAHVVLHLHLLVQTIVETLQALT